MTAFITLRDGPDAQMSRSMIETMACNTAFYEGLMTKRGTIEEASQAYRDWLTEAVAKVYADTLSMEGHVRRMALARGYIRVITEITVVQEERDAALAQLPSCEPLARAGRCDPSFRNTHWAEDVVGLYNQYRALSEGLRLFQKERGILAMLDQAPPTADAHSLVKGLVGANLIRIK